MPFFNETDAPNQAAHPPRLASYVHSLEDSFRQNIPVTSVEFNPPPVSSMEKQETAYWLDLAKPDKEDKTILKGLRAKIKALRRCHRIDSFISVTDSAAGVLRLHNLSMIRLLTDSVFMDRHFKSAPLIWEPRRTIIHLTRNHDIAWLRSFLNACLRLNFKNLLVITGDPLKEIRLNPVTAAEAGVLSPDEESSYRLKNSVELLKFIATSFPQFYVGVGHNPFLNLTAAGNHLRRKAEAGARYIITQPVSYYEECWRVIRTFESFRAESAIDIPVVLGVFNYYVPCGNLGFNPEEYVKKHRFWKKLFGFVPDGVRQDYEWGMNGIEILARSITKLKRMGYYHFDVMNAERQGWSVVINEQRLAHESNRIEGAFDLRG